MTHICLQWCSIGQTGKRQIPGLMTLTVCVHMVSMQYFQTGPLWITFLTWTWFGLVGPWANIPQQSISQEPTLTHTASHAMFISGLVSGTICQATSLAFYHSILYRLHRTRNPQASHNKQPASLELQLAPVNARDFWTRLYPEHSFDFSLPLLL